MLFDQYSRYNALKKILNLLKFNKINTLLDVGSGPECLLGSIIDSEHVTYVDPLISKNESMNIIKGNIFSEKLNNKKFDFVAAIDVLEHIPFAIRNSFIERLCELAENCIILAFPTSENKPSTQIDESVNESYKKTYGIDYPWLEEHFTYSLPSVEQIKAKFKALGWECSSIGHGYAPWLQEMMNLLIPTWDSLELHNILFEMSREFNKNLVDYDFNKPYYREFLIISKEANTLDFSVLTKKIPDNVEIYYREMLKKYKKLLFFESLKIIERQNKDIQEFNKDIQRISKHIKSQSDQLEIRDQMIIEKQELLMEMSDWGQGLNQRVIDLENNKRELNDQLEALNHQLQKKQHELMQISDWGQSLSHQLQKKQHELMQMSDWANDMKKRLQNIESSRILIFFEKHLTCSTRFGKLIKILSRIR
ncbi:hypothetical protein [Sulfurospirillum sp.]|uniref:hypothetical protein n=1 Tax=Sulfurospirillum sp. TaxID=2053622 RepID=UPI002FDD0AE2